MPVGKGIYLEIEIVFTRFFDDIIVVNIIFEILCCADAIVRTYIIIGE